MLDIRQGSVHIIITRVTFLSAGGTGVGAPERPWSHGPNSDLDHKQNVPSY